MSLISKNKVKPRDLQKLLRICLNARQTPNIAGSPGIGKSDIVRELAAEANLKVIDLRLSQCAPEDLQGYPMLVNDKARFVPFDAFPVAGEPLPKVFNKDGSPVMIPNPKAGQPAQPAIIQKTYNGWLLFLDEISSARKEVQAAAYKLILDRQVGSLDLHDKVYTVAAGNLESDNAIVYPMSTALQSRMIHFELQIDQEAWLIWAYKNHIDPRITAFINFSKTKLMNFDPDHTDKTYACPRTWHMLSKTIKGLPVNLVQNDGLWTKPLVFGTIGEGVGLEFMTFCAVYKDLPSYADIISQSATIHIPSKPEVRFAIISMLINDAKLVDVKEVLEFMSRFSKEFQIIFHRGITNRDRRWRTNPLFAKTMLDMIDSIT